MDVEVEFGVMWPYDVIIVSCRGLLVDINGELEALNR